MTAPDWDSTGRDWPNRTASLFLRAGRTEWHVQRMGEGPVMLLLHGAGGATHSWRDLMPLLGETHDVIAPDLPGHGFSCATAGQTSTLPGMAEEVAALLASLDTQPEVIVGHSAGAAIALELTLTRQALPRVIIGLNPALTPFRGLAGVLFPPMAKMLALNPLTPWAFSRVAGWSGQARRLIEGTGSRIDGAGLEYYARLFATPRHVSGALSMMAHWDLEPMLERLGELTVPVHLVVGDRDQAVPPHEAARLAEAHEIIALHRFEGLGHVMHEEDPHRFAALIAELSTAGAPPNS